MLDVTNEQRAGWAALAVDAFVKATKSDACTDEALRDLLSDLMHYADACGYDWTDCIEKAAEMYDEEVAEDGGYATEIERP